MNDLVFWLLGGFSGASASTAGPLALGLFAALIGAWLLSRPLDILSLGEETAGSLGLSTGRVRLAAVGLATLSASAAVGAGGLIGFVGLVAPHLCRAWLGPRHALLIPSSALAGASLVLAADIPARLLAAPGEIPVGIVTALIGGPFFIYLLRKRAV